MSIVDLIQDTPAAARREIVVDAKTGQPRQAGAASPEGQWIVQQKQTAERSLYYFAKAILGLDRLTESLHLPECSWLARCPPYRKLLLMPRDHLKTSIVSRSLPLHILIQSKQANIYFPGRRGINLRILLAGETAGNAEAQLGWIQARLEANPVLRAMWPHILWDNPRQEARKWNAQALMLRRDEDYPEASIETIGVGGAVTGRHYNIIIKDDLTTLEAANSSTVMATAIEWHETSRALFDDPDKSLEFIIGTRWAVHDLYQHVIDNDPTVEVRKRSIVEDGKIIFPEMFSRETIEQLKKRFGTLFPLLYMNDASDPELVDFPESGLREFKIVAGNIVFDEDERDFVLARKHNAPKPDFSDALRGKQLTREQWGDLWSRGEGYLRLKYG